MLLFDIYKDIFSSFGPSFRLLFHFWWIWFPPFSFAIFYQSWMNYIHQYYKAEQQWGFLEIRIPRSLKLGPKAMEQFLNNVHGLRNAPGDIVEWYWDGEVTLWFSFEIVSLGGELHYYMRVPKKQVKSFQSQLYAQYSDIEVYEVNDYFKERFPETVDELYKQGYNIWGSEVLLEKANCYPIRTYVEFESPNEFENLDPVAAALELLKKIDKRENIIIQILARPADDTWQKKGDELVKKMKEDTLLKVKSVGASGEEEEQVFGARTPGEIEVLKAVENKISKHGYEVIIRYMYIADRSIFSATFARRGIIAALKQYGSHSLNSFRHNYRVWTLVKWVYFPFLFSNRRAEGRKRRLYYFLRNRKMMEGDILGKILSSGILSWDLARSVAVLNTEELATIYHFPNETVLTAPLIKRKESKTLGPPAELPIFGSEEDEGTFEKLFQNSNNTENT